MGAVPWLLLLLLFWHANGSPVSSWCPQGQWLHSIALEALGALVCVSWQEGESMKGVKGNQMNRVSIPGTSCSLALQAPWFSESISTATPLSLSATLSTSKLITLLCKIPRVAFQLLETKRPPWGIPPQIPSFSSLHAFALITLLPLECVAMGVRI